MKILVIDVGGTHVKLLATGQTEMTKIPSGPEMTPHQFVDDVNQATATWDFEAVSIGFPAPVVEGKVAVEPINLGKGWMGFDFGAPFKRPVQLVNDAAMQALGSYEGGRMLFMGLGTGLGTAIVVEKLVIPTELAHLPFRKKLTFEDYVGIRGLERLGKKKWLKAVDEVVRLLRMATIADYVVLGGGNSRLVKKLPEGARMGNNNNAFVGGMRLWEENVRVAMAKPETVEKVVPEKVVTEQ
jgi:predicted NBD/HSP70 family sugar kinase